jgi:hypothetical protein
MKGTSLSYESIRSALSSRSLFEDKSWVISPEPWSLNATEYEELLEIGKACADFYQAQERLYRLSAEGKNLLRNSSLKAPWVAEYLDRGKPQRLIDHGRNRLLKNAKPMIIRPDLLLTDSGYALTEIDAVPGGIGLTAFLNQLYASNGYPVIGSKDAMVTGFYETLSLLTPAVSNPVLAIVVSEESAVYRPEFRWIAEKLREIGKPVYCISPDQIMPLGKTLCAPVDGNPEKIDIIYRFYELFDFQNISTVDMILQAVEEGEVVVTPPMKAYQEEKLSLGLFHHHMLEGYWRENLSNKALKVLSKIIPMTWIIDPVELPPTAVLHAPHVSGRPISSWEELGNMSQKERNLIIKVSGFHETAWGARSVVCGSDVSKNDWVEAIDRAIEMSPSNMSVLQDYRKTKLLEHPVYLESGEVVKMEGRLRLCPYYFVEEENIRMLGALATFCPADKKIIHGMKDAALLPCYIR